jgi:signal transduction histidine kinase
VRERAEKITAAGLTLDLRGTPAVGKVTGDVRRLRKVFGLLIDNAMAATPEGGRILVECTRQAHDVRVVSPTMARAWMRPRWRAMEGLS